jgi:excisionase family DNA binding protein
MSLPNLYTPEEVAEKLKVKRRAVYQWLTVGKLAGMKVGQGWRITEEDLLAFMNKSPRTGKKVTTNQ